MHKVAGLRNIKASVVIESEPAQCDLQSTLSRQLLLY
jgi:hypothetical protein